MLVVHRHHQERKRQEKVQRNQLLVQQCVVEHLAEQRQWKNENRSEFK